MVFCSLANCCRAVNSNGMLYSDGLLSVRSFAMPRQGVSRMWQAVDPNNPSQLQQAVDVLLVHDPSWVSSDHLKDWITAHSAQLFYYSDPSFRLVVGFTRDNPKKEWRAAV